jgi:hypothetical protein
MDTSRLQNELVVKDRDYLSAHKEDALKSLREHRVFKQPLSLGGADEVSNYEVTDMEVYWEINRQIFLQIRNLSAE